MNFTPNRDRFADFLYVVLSDALDFSLDFRFKFFWTMALLTALARFCIFINLVSLSHQFLFADTSMLIRVRNNFGTFKVFLEDGKEAMLSDVLNDDIFEPWKLVQELSTDPSGKDKVSKDLTLSQQGLEHGSLIFCRVEERSLLESDSENDASSVIVDDSKPKPKVSGEKSAGAGAAASQPQGLSFQQDVIELLDSSDDEDGGTSEMSAKRRPPPSNTSNQTFKNKKARPTATSTVASSSSYPSINDFRIASYNVWFGPPDPDANQVYPRQRMTAIAQALKEFNSKPVSSPLLFIGFQELTESLKQYLTPVSTELNLKRVRNDPTVSTY